jgi:AbrB family looped-hinge helix DNA binding protein
MALSKVRTKGQVTIPNDVRLAAHIDEGTVVEFTVVDDGVLMRPKKLVDAADAWFWLPRWQEGEREASRQLAAGKGEVDSSDDEFFAALDKD